MTPLLFAWGAEIGLITWRDFKSGRTVLGMPPPSDYFATFIVFGSLMAIGTAGGEGGRTFASAAGWSLVLASALNLINPTFVQAPGPQKTDTNSPALQPQGASTNG